MVTSEVEIYNLALSAIGHSSSVAVQDEISREAELCRLWFPQVRDKVLKAAPWSSARAETRLAVYRTRDFNLDWTQLDPSATWSYAYTAPTDMIHPRHSVTFQRFIMSEFEGAMRVMSGEENKILVYTKRQDNFSLWDQDLLMSIVYGLGATIAMPLSAKVSRAKELYALANDAILTARVANANEDHYELESMPEWLTVRGASAGTYPNRYVYPVGPTLSLGNV